MLAFSAPGPFDSRRHIFEPKWDGLRLVGFRREGRVWLQSRRGNDLSPAFPELARALAEAPGPERLIADGELVTPGPDGRPCFAAALARSRMHRPDAVARAAGEWPAVWVVFDLLYWDRKDLRRQPLQARRDALERWAASWPAGVARCLALSPAVVGAGRALFEHSRRRGLEGMVAKELDSPYQAHRSRQWLKVKAFREEVALVVGFVPDGPEAVRSLAVALPGPGARPSPAARDVAAWSLAGLVGTGMPGDERVRLRRRLQTLGPPLARPAVAVPTGAWRAHGELQKVVWVRPALGCRLRYLERTEGGWLRHASYRGLVGG